MQHVVLLKSEHALATPGQVIDRRGPHPPEPDDDRVVPVLHAGQST
jgi:hypothetical protein